MSCADGDWYFSNRQIILGVEYMLALAETCKFSNDGLEIHWSKGAVYTFDAIEADGAITEGGYSTHIGVV